MESEGNYDPELADDEEDGADEAKSLEDDKGIALNEAKDELDDAEKYSLDFNLKKGIPDDKSDSPVANPKPKHNDNPADDRFYSDDEDEDDYYEEDHKKPAENGDSSPVTKPFDLKGLLKI